MRDTAMSTGGFAELCILYFSGDFRDYLIGVRQCRARLSKPNEIWPLMGAVRTSPGLSNGDRHPWTLRAFIAAAGVFDDRLYFPRGGAIVDCDELLS